MNHPHPNLPPAKRSRTLLALLAVLGLVAPWYHNLMFFASGGSTAPDVFFGAAMANPLTTAITLDVYIAAAAFSLGVAWDRSAGKLRWLAIPATFLIALSFALPAYLWWRLGRCSSRPAASDHQGDVGRA